MIANRLLPDAVPNSWPAGWPNRGSLEQYAFWATWALALGHAFWRSAPVAQGRMSPAWREQCWAIAALAVCAVVLNWVTTGDHLIKTLGAGYWPVAGVDLFILTGAAVALLAARKLTQRAQGAPATPARATPPAPTTETAHA